METINYNDDYSNSYRKQLAHAIHESRQLGFNRSLFIAEGAAVGDDTFRKAAKLVTDHSAKLARILPAYWGNCCQTLSSHIYALLNSAGIPAEIVLGTVIINGTDELRATEPLAGHQSVHAWITLGDDTIIDAALPPRLAKHYGAPENFSEMILMNRATVMSARYLLRYQPLLVGTEFFAKTNPPDPMDVLRSYCANRGQ